MTDLIIWGLLPVSCLTSTISAITGLGGGMILMAFMTPFFTPLELIPAHGTVQLGSNFSRVWLHRNQIKWKPIRAFLLGAVLISLAGPSLLKSVKPELIGIFIPCAILTFTWMPKFKFPAHRKNKIHFSKFFTLGVLAVGLSIFIGVTGPLVHPFFLRENLTKEQFIATEGLCSLITHAFKLAIYMSAGIFFKDKIYLVLGMIPFVFIGSIIGKRVLGKINPSHFVWGLKILVSLLSLRMILIWINL